MKPGTKVVIDGHAATIVSVSKYHLFVYFEDNTDIAIPLPSAHRMHDLGRLVEAQDELPLDVKS